MREGRVFFIQADCFSYLKIFILLCVTGICSPTSAQMPEVVLPLSHSAPIYSTRFIQNGKYILTLSYDNTAKLWDVPSGRLLHTFKDLHHGPLHVRETGNTSLVSPDEKYFFAITVEGFLNKWELPSAKLTFSRKVASYNAALTMAGGYLLVKSREKEKATGELIHGVSGKTIVKKQAASGNYSNLTEIELSPDGNNLYVLEGELLVIHPLNTGRQIEKIRLGENPSGISFSPNGDYIYYFSGNSDSIGLYNIKLKQHFKLFETGYFEFSPDSRKMISTTKSLRLIDPLNRESIQSLDDYDRPSMLAHFTKDGKYIYLTRTNGLIRGMEPYDSITKIWETSSGRLISVLKMDAGDISSVVLSPDHSYTATISSNTALWDSSGKKIREFNSRLIAFDPQNRSIAVTGDTDVSIYSLKNGLLLSILKGSSKRLVNASLSKDGRSLVSLTGENHLKIWSLNFGKVDRAVKQPAAVKTADFTADPSVLFLTTGDSAKIVDANDGQTIYAVDRKINSAKLSQDGKLLVITSGKQGFIKRITGQEDIFSFSEDYEISNAALSADGKFAWYIFGQSAAGVINLAKGKIHRIYLGEENIQHCEFSPDGKLFFILGENATARLYNSETGLLHKSFSERSRTEYAVTSLFPEGNYLPASWEGENHVFTGNGRSIIFRTYMDRYIVLRHLDDMDKPDTIFTKNQLVLQAAAIPNSLYIITVTTDDTIRVWQKKNRIYKVVKAFPGNGFKLTPDGKMTILVNDSQLALLETRTLTLLMKAIGMNETDFFTQPGNEPWYMATKDAVRKLTFRYNGGYYSYEQFDLRFNRPDKVLSGIGYADKKLIATYRNAYDKRLRRLGLSTAAFSNAVSTPAVVINNRDDIDYEQTSDLVDLVITASDKKSSLNKFHIWVNEVPLYGSAGLDLKKRNKLDTSIKIPLSDSQNIIEASVSNLSGSESYRYPLHVLYNPAIPAEEKLWFVGIGIDSYANARYNLSYCVKDIRDLALKLRSKYGAAIKIDTLFNEQVTISNILALRKELMRSSINDKVILSYSGHGLLTKGFDYYLSTYSVDFARPEKSGLSFQAFESLIDSIPARKKLMLIDACHSGEVDKEEMRRYKTGIASAEKNGVKGGELLIIDSTASLGMKNSFELMQELFINVGRSTGATIISAAAGTQLALEKGDLKNGVFTYSILEFMENNTTATVSQLKEYVNKRVSELTNGLQVPTTRTETRLVDWRVW